MPPDDTIVSQDPGDTPGPLADAAPGVQVGPYRLVSRLGEGGFGEVWLGERREPFVQQVAVKLVKAGMDSRAVVARFEQERQALAVMAHPGIAKVFDGGLTSRGRPYFAMEFVRGEPITQFCDRHRLSIRDRLALFAQVCDAVQHAHTKGIIHRDLKPTNILASMGPEDAPQAKVIDFGVSKALLGPLTERTLFTESGQMVGTPEYMSPEQADPGALDIDTRSDVYSLGVVLYELLSGMLPFDPRDLRSRAYREIQRMIREADPPTPSARLSTMVSRDTQEVSRICAARREQPSRLATTLRSELEWIPLKAMRKDRHERYGTATDLARDVRNYLAGLPLVAAPESVAYRIRKYVRRNKATVAATGAVTVALLAGLSIATWQWREASAQRDAAERSAAEERVAKALAEVEADRARAAAAEALDQRERLTAALEFLTKLLGRADPHRGGSASLTLIDSLRSAMAEVDAGIFARAPDLEAQIRSCMGALMVNGSGDLPGAAAQYESAIAIAERDAAIDPGFVAETCRDLSVVRGWLGQDEAAEALSRRALAAAEQLPEPDPVLVASCLNRLGTCCTNSGKAQESIMHLERALALVSTSSVPKAVEIRCNTLCNLGRQFRRLGRGAEADRLLSESVACWESIGGDNRPSIAYSLNELALGRLDAGDLASAERLLERALGVSDRLLGPDHPDGLMFKTNLMLVYSRQGNVTKGLRFLAPKKRPAASPGKADAEATAPRSGGK